jgi:pectate lyase C
MKPKFLTMCVIALVVSIAFLSCSKEEESAQLSQTSSQEHVLKATKTITSTIVVAAGQTYDGGGETIVASGMGDGSQDEGQDPIFRLEEGAKLLNVIIAAPGCDGVHVYGNCSVNNVTWQDIGEDALTVKSGTLSTNVNITNCKLYKAADKIFQINAPCNFKMNSIYCDDFGKVVRQNGGTTWQCNIYFNGGTFKNGDECLARTDSPLTQIRYRNMTVSNVSTYWIVPSSSQVKTY